MDYQARWNSTHYFQIDNRDDGDLIN